MVTVVPTSPRVGLNLLIVGEVDDADADERKSGRKPAMVASTATANSDLSRIPCPRFPASELVASKQFDD